MGASVQGASHIRNNLPNQDALLIESVGGCQIVSLSDGHGSTRCPHSDEGSEAAVDTVNTVFRSILAEKGDLFRTVSANKDIWLPKQIEKCWKQKIVSIHKEKGRGDTESKPNQDNFPYELYGATLLTLVATDDFVFALQLGDGDILSIEETDENAREETDKVSNEVSENVKTDNENLRITWVIPPEEAAGAETNSLCQENCWQYMKTRIIPIRRSSQGSRKTKHRQPALRHLFLMATDGYSNSFYNDEGFKKAGADFYKLWQEEGPEYIKENLNNWLTESSAKGSGDDITLALLH